jgi:hypothetical protein
MTTPEDGDYKLLFSHPQMVRELLRDWVPGEWIAQVGVDPIRYTVMSLS